MTAISSSDQQVIRELAKQVAELAAKPTEGAKIAEWKRHNRFQRGKPMVLVCMEDVWEELVPDASLQCESDDCRDVERELRRRLYLAEHIRDDRPISGTWEVNLAIGDSGYGITDDCQQPACEHGRAGAIYRQTLTDDTDPEDIFALREPTIDREATDRQFELISDLLGDILTVRVVGQQMFCYTPVDWLAILRGVEQFFLDLVDRPKWIHALLRRLTESDLHYTHQAEAAGVIELNNGSTGFAHGPECITDELPAADFDGSHVRLRDTWGFSAAQVFSEVSPAMHEEFATQYEAPCLELFGANCYGCCEPLHKKMDVVRKLPRVKRVSMSPWVDHVAGAEVVGSDMIYSSKPTPALTQGLAWDIEPCRKEIVTILDAARANACQLEIILNGTLTCRGQPHRYDQWADMVQQLTQEYA